MEITDLEETFEAQNHKKQAHSIRLAAMNALARREHSRQELFTKLSQRFDEIAIIEAALFRLSEEGLQDDRRFAEAFVRYRCEKGQGPLRIQQELKQKGVAESLITDALSQPEIDWSVVAQRTYRKKYADKPITDRNERARRQRFMQYRGFSFDHFDIQ